MKSINAAIPSNGSSFQKDDTDENAKHPFGMRIPLYCVNAEGQ
jgi:hypothetical protein